MTARGVERRARALLASRSVTLDTAGPTLLTAHVALYRPGAPRWLRVAWTPGGWSCGCTPRQPGPCPHVLAVRGLLAALDPDHPALTADPWETTHAPL